MTEKTKEIVLTLQETEILYLILTVSNFKQVPLDNVQGNRAKDQVLCSIIEKFEKALDLLRG